MEKADILELAIRCLEGKEQESDTCNEKQATRITDRKPFENLKRLENNSSPRRQLETTPIRMSCTKAVITKFEENENTPCKLHKDFKPLLRHPIRSFSINNEYSDVIQMDQSDQSPIKTSDSPKKIPIWRPWTL